MLCLAFHNPADLSLMVDREKYGFGYLFDEADAKKLVAYLALTKNNILFVNNIDRLIDFYRNHPSTINQFKIVAFDTPQNFEKNKIEVKDAKCKKGTWTYKKITKSFDLILDELDYGLGEYADRSNGA
jgi:hypothetical protein